MGTFNLQRHERPSGPRFPIGTAAITRHDSPTLDDLALAIAQDDSAPVETIARSLSTQQPRDAYVANVFLLCYKIAKLQCRHHERFDDYFAAGVDVAFRLVDLYDFARLENPDQRIAYAYRSISNEIIDQHRRKEAESRGIERLFHEQLAETKCKRSEIEELEHKEHIDSQMKRVERCLDGGDMLDGDREVVEVMRQKGDLSSKELADELGTTVGTARQRLHRAKKRLRKALCLDGKVEGELKPRTKKLAGRANARAKKPVEVAATDTTSPFTLDGATIKSAAVYSLQDPKQDQTLIW